MSLTGANADEWVPVKPGTEGVLALGLAHVILREQAAAGGRGRPRRRARSTAGRPASPTTRRSGSSRSTGVAADARRAARARVRGRRAGRRDHRRRAARAHQRPVPGARGQRAERARSAASAQPGGLSSRRRHVRQLAGRRRARQRPPTRLCREAVRARCCCSTTRIRCSRRRRRGSVREALDEDPVHRQLRQLRRRDERAGRSDPAGSLVPRVVGRRRAGVRRDGRRGERRRRRR